MEMDHSQMLDQAIQILKPAATAGHVIASRVAASALWDWMKEKFKKHPDAAKAVLDLEKSPAKEENWAVLREQLAKAIAEDEVFCEELRERLHKEVQPPVTQTMTQKGHNNKGVENTGSGNTIIIQ
jgi:hypothetical protein